MKIVAYIYRGKLCAVAEVMSDAMLMSANMDIEKDDIPVESFYDSSRENVKKWVFNLKNSPCPAHRFIFLTV